MSLPVTNRSIWSTTCRNWMQPTMMIRSLHHKRFRRSSISSKRPSSTATVFPTKASTVLPSPSRMEVFQPTVWNISSMPPPIWIKRWNSMMTTSPSWLTRKRLRRKPKKMSRHGVNCLFKTTQTKSGMSKALKITPKFRLSSIFLWSKQNLAISSICRRRSGRSSSTVRKSTIRSVKMAGAT